MVWHPCVQLGEAQGQVWFEKCAASRAQHTAAGQLDKRCQTCICNAGFTQWIWGARQTEGSVRGSTSGGRGLEVLEEDKPSEVWAGLGAPM